MGSKSKWAVKISAFLLALCFLGFLVLINFEQIQQAYQDKYGPKQEVIAYTDNSQITEKVVNPFYETYQLDPDRNPTAFLQDDEFFDPEKEEEDVTKNISLFVSTVQKDIRIHVVDYLGNPIKGETFQVFLNRRDEKLYSDEDQDGMILIEDLPSGKYEISLVDKKEYVSPSKPTYITVNDEITYDVLEDISFMVHTEDEIDPKVEDTKVNQAELDADGTETNVRLSDGASVFGIDVSKWNKEIDWKKVKDAGCEFAIIRLGYRGSKTGALVEDPFFVKNIEGAIEQDIRVGVYFFTQATNEIEAVEEASMTLMLAKKYKISYPLFIDTEGAGGNGRADKLDKAQRTKVMKAFCETIENAGFTAGIYASKSWLNNNLNMNELKSYQTWLAQYSNKPSYQGEYGMWQYTSAGRLDGISTLVDFDVSYMDY